MDQAAILDHEFLVAAYVVVWVIQLSYLAYLGYRWRVQKKQATGTREQGLGIRHQAIGTSELSWPHQRRVPRGLGREDLIISESNSF